MRYCYRALVVMLVLLHLGSNLSCAQQEKWIRISLIKASKAKSFTFAKKIRSLQDQLKQFITDKKNPEKYKVLKDFRHFEPIHIFEKQRILIAKPSAIPLNKEKTAFLEITLNPFQKDYFPTQVRWFRKEKDREKNIIKLQQYQFKQGRSLILTNIVRNASTCSFLAIELIAPPRDQQPAGSDSKDEG